MKNLFLCLILAFLVPEVASSQYWFGAHVYSQDPCCIYVAAGSRGEANWTVVIDGVETYGPGDFMYGRFLLRCYEGNGTHTVQFFVDGELYWTEIVEITDCDKSCNLCEFGPLEIMAEDLDGDCMTMFDVTGGDSPDPECMMNAMYTWNFGDGNTEGPNPDPNTMHSYDEDGTYEACVVLSYTSPDGEECSMSTCTEVVVTDCTPQEPCCSYELYSVNAQTLPAFDPCIVRLSASYQYSPTECPGTTWEWDLDGDGIPEYSSTSSSSWVFYVDSEGPFEACFTMRNADGTCSVSDCVTWENPGCMGFDGGSSDRSADLDIPWGPELHVYPNPASDFININLNQDAQNPVEMVSIMDNTGKVISSQRPNNDSFMMMDVSELPQGMYMIQAIDQSGAVSTERFVKTK